MRTRTFDRVFRFGVVAMVAMGMTWAANADAGARIVGGTDAPPSSWPAIAAIATTQVDLTGDGLIDNLDTFCGGTLIHREWVVTAAHCLELEDRNDVGEIAVALGVTNLATDPGQTRGVSAIVRHPAFDEATLENDVALLHLESQATLGATVALMDLVSPIRSELWDDGSPAEVAGWGDTAGDGTAYATVLQQANIAVIGDATCNALLGNATPLAFRSASMLCAGDLAGGVDTCNGDSGGPLTVRDAGARMLVGATSWGSMPCGLPNFPGVYTRLDAYRGFIFGPTGLNQLPPPVPTSPDATAPTLQSAIVSWTAPQGSARPVTGYRVRTFEGGISGTATVLAAGLTNVTVTGLTSGGDYTFAVEAANGAGVSGQTARVAAHAPTADSPVVTGEARRGAALAVAMAPWKYLVGEPASHQWQRCDAAGVTCVDIAGATGPTLALTEADVGHRIRVRATATNNKATTTVVSAPTAPVVPLPPVVLVRPAVSGVAQVGATLQPAVGSWSDAVTTAIVWQSCDAQGAGCVDISGSTSGPLTVGEALVGRRVRVVVTATNPGGSTAATSDPTAAVLAAASAPVVTPTPAPAQVDTGPATGVPTPASITPARLAIVTLRPVTVKQTAAGLVTVRTRVRIEPGAVVRVRVTDHRRKPRVLNLAKSRIGGTRPHRVAAGVVSAVVGVSGEVEVTIVFSGTQRAARRVARLEIETRARGDQARVSLPFRARI